MLDYTNMGVGTVNLNIYISYNNLPFGFYVDYPLTLCFAIKNVVYFLSNIKNKLLSEMKFSRIQRHVQCYRNFKMATYQLF